MAAENVRLSPMNPGPTLPAQLVFWVHLLFAPPPFHVTPLAVKVSGVMM